LPTGQSLLFIVFASESYSGVGSEKGYADSWKLPYRHRFLWELWVLLSPSNSYMLLLIRITINHRFWVPSLYKDFCHSVSYFQHTQTKTITQCCSKHTKFSIPVTAK
jgi:hypothetical protein